MMIGEYSLGSLIDPSKIKEKELILILKELENRNCWICTDPVTSLKNPKCGDDCWFTSKSNCYPDKPFTKGNRIGCRSKFAELLGIDKLVQEVGRSQLVYLFKHLELGWRMPQKPQIDIFGNECDPDKPWILHHYIHRFDDLHQVRCTWREHKTLDAMCRRGDLTLINILLKTRERSPDLEPGVILSKSQREEYYRCWKQNGNGVWGLKENKVDVFQNLWK